MTFFVVSYVDSRAAVIAPGSYHTPACPILVRYLTKPDVGEIVGLTAIGHDSREARWMNVLNLRNASNAAALGDVSASI